MLFERWEKKILGKWQKVRQKCHSPLLWECDRLQSAPRTVLPCKNCIPLFVKFNYILLAENIWELLSFWLFLKMKKQSLLLVMVRADWQSSNPRLNKSACWEFPHLPKLISFQINAWHLFPWYISNVHFQLFFLEVSFLEQESFHGSLQAMSKIDRSFPTFYKEKEKEIYFSTI